MKTLRPAAERGHADHGWLRTAHSFSFASYRDPRHMGFRSLRVLNDDHVAPREGFGLHPHDNMEIMSYVVAGALVHRDTAGHEATVRRGGIQFMSAGSGIAHSEFNGTPDTWVHLLQIWLRPAARDTAPRYEDRDLEDALAATAGDRPGWVTLLAPDGRDGAIRVGQDAVVLASRPAVGTTLRHDLAPGRGAWVQVVSGDLTLDDGTRLAPGDGLAVTDEPHVALTATTDAELLLFDLA